MSAEKSNNSETKLQKNYMEVNQTNQSVPSPFVAAFAKFPRSSGLVNHTINRDMSTLRSTDIKYVTPSPFFLAMSI